MAEDMKQRLKVEELAENIDELEDVVEDVFPLLMITVVISSLILIVFLIRMYLKYSVKNPSKNRMDDRTVLITGGTSGLGKATAVELAKKNAKVIITGRDLVKAEAIARNIRKKTGNQQVSAVQLDLGNLRNIREFAEDFNKSEKFLHVLINNAAYLGPKSVTDDGLERTFAVNYLGHFYLTHLLTDKLKKNAPSRIINVISDSYVRGSIDFDDLALNKGYNVYGAYSRSKLAQVLFMLECHRRLFSSCVWSFGVHPGACNTELLRNYPGMTGNILRVISRVMFKPPDDGCQTIVYCAVSDGLRDFSGKIFVNCKALKPSDKVKDKEVARKLWATSAQLCGFEDDSPPEEVAPKETAEAASPEEKKEQ
ncbi:hypothetical protein BsWGS_07691 [Bradybaena similaris]